MKKTGSLIGSSRGFTLFELLITVTVLTAGIAVILPALFRSSGIPQYLNSRYEATLVANNLFVKASETLRDKGSLKEWTHKGTVYSSDQAFEYYADVDLQKTLGVPNTVLEKKLYKIDLDIQWAGVRKGQIRRSAYVGR